MLTYYKDTFTIGMIKESNKQTGKTEEEIITEYEKSLKETTEENPNPAQTKMTFDDIGRQEGD